MSDEQQTTPLPDVPALGASFEQITPDEYGERHGYSNSGGLANAFKRGYIYAKLERALTRLCRDLYADTHIGWDYYSNIEVTLGKQQAFAHLAQLLTVVQAVLGGEWSSDDFPEQKRRTYQLRTNTGGPFETDIIAVHVYVDKSEHCRVMREEIGEEVVKKYKTTLVCEEPVAPAAPAATAGEEGEGHDT